MSRNYFRHNPLFMSIVDATRERIAEIAEECAVLLEKAEVKISGEQALRAFAKEVLGKTKSDDET